LSLERTLINPTEVVFNSDDVVFAEIVACLNFEDFERFYRRDVLDSVMNVASDERRLASPESVLLFADRDFRCAAGDYPRFITMTMPL